MSLHFNADEVFRIGMEVELNGKAFYDEASKRCESDTLRPILELLRDEEQKHYEAFAAMREKLPTQAAEQTVFDPDGQMGAYLKALADSHVFTSATHAADLARQCENEIELLGLALQFEKDSVLMFQTMKELTRADLGQKQIEWLIGEEQEHVRKIAGVLNTIQGAGA